jgi:DNA-binding Lrp family transcriptional regulator
LAWDESKGIVVDPFIGRGAALNRAIIYVLGAKQPQTTRQISKSVKNIPDFRGTSTSTVNKRVRDLEKHGYLRKVQVIERVGGITNYYMLTPQAYLMKFLDTNHASELFTGLSGEMATIILVDLIKAKEEKEGKKPSIL